MCDSCSCKLPNQVTCKNLECVFRRLDGLTPLSKGPMLAVQQSGKILIEITPLRMSQGYWDILVFHCIVYSVTYPQK